MTHAHPNKLQDRRNSDRAAQTKRPSSITELAEKATIDGWDNNKHFKHYLRLAEKHRKEGKEHAKRGDIEPAFIELARAATLVLEKLPEHKDYGVVLSATQRHNLGLNGQDILDNLGELKPTLVDRYDKWLKSSSQQQQDGGGAGADLDRTPSTRPQKITDESPTKGQPPPAPPTTTKVRNDPAAAPGSSRHTTTARAQHAMDEELDRWRQQRVEAEARDHQTQRTRRKEAAAAAAQKAANIPRLPPPPDLTFSKTPMQNAGYGTQNTVVIADPRPPPPPPQRSSSSSSATAVVVDEVGRHQQQQQQQQEELRLLRDEDIARRQAEKRRQDQQEGIARRQREAEEAARLARLSLVDPSKAVAGFGGHAYYHPPHVEYPSLHPGAKPGPSPRPPDRQVSYLDARADGRPGPGPALLPLENPSRYEGESTDSESVYKNHNHGHGQDFRRVVHQRTVEHRTPVKHVRSPAPYPVPITTTSPAPDAGAPIRYPALMSPHQKTQGYYPSLGSMFADSFGANHGNASLLFGANANEGVSKVNGSLYSSGPIATPTTTTTTTTTADPQQSYFGARPLLLPPPAVSSSSSHVATPQGNHNHNHQHHHQHADVAVDRIIRPSEASEGVLKTVNLPRECLPRFLAIAKVNTETNRETCGLLLGKDKGYKFVVTTLLIPKQHSTSDTCTMDEEELVLQFTEERSLITLGWIHTHPSQSCFMSSVDLHTHSGFQRMLPESFAVVCAPKSNPNFGIFRLTDPPGLQSILRCEEKEAFHPHPDMPIYTDADKGHVQIKDCSLEIVDLR